MVDLYQILDEIREREMFLSTSPGCGGLVLGSRLRGRRVPDSKPDSTEDPSYETNLYVSGEVHKQNDRKRKDSNPHWMSECKSQGAEKLMVWCGIWSDRIECQVLDG
ncbi:hypothetical protein AVEN_50144-1 [Araneus ventricosus]|uniref:Uncharacterized protein n=1 Tax=Araneus ventricosus TaxID=182803 RepID=A0A4Y2DC22_ARAVE|nr:hypothetical protein AVEN_50144-1 [Araneus ventricosus]